MSRCDFFHVINVEKKDCTRQTETYYSHGNHFECVGENLQLKNPPIRNFECLFMKSTAAPATGNLQASVAMNN